MASHIHVFMQLSMGTLNLHSTMVVKYSTPSQRWTLSCINFGNGESSANLLLNMLILYLAKYEARWILKGHVFFFLLLYFFYLKVNLDLEKQISLVNLHPNLLFTVGNLGQIVIE